jgi:hypothetical protein
MKTYSQFISDLQERYYKPDEKLPSGKTPYGKSRSSYFRNKRKYEDKPDHEERMRHLRRSIKQITRSNDQVKHGADNPNYNSHYHPDADVYTNDDKRMRVTSKGISYYVSNSEAKTKDGKPIHSVMWNHKAGYDNNLSDAEKKQVARDAKHVWYTHVQHRLPHGSVLVNSPLSNSTDKDPSKNTRAKLYQRAGFGPLNKGGDQFASVGREPSPKQKAKGKKRLKPISGEWEDIVQD